MIWELIEIGRYRCSFIIDYPSTMMSKAKQAKKRIIEVLSALTQDSDDESDSSLPIIAPKPSKKKQVQEKKVVKKPVKPESSDEDETPIAPKKTTKQHKADTGVVKKAAKPVASKKQKQPSSSEEEDSDEDAKPMKKAVKVKSPQQKPVVAAKKAKVPS